MTGELLLRHDVIYDKWRVTPMLHRTDCPFVGVIPPHLVAGYKKGVTLAPRVSLCRECKPDVAVRGLDAPERIVPP